MEMEEADGFRVLTYVPIPKLPYGNPGTTYTLVEMSSPGSGLCCVCIVDASHPCHSLTCCFSS